VAQAIIRPIVDLLYEIAPEKIELKERPRQGCAPKQLNN
jgi:hypothetical protein